METWRCPTCFAVLNESGAKRCPQCHSRLRKRRSQPIVLGETSRLDRQAALIVDRQNKLKAERVFAVTEAPRAAASAAAPSLETPADIDLTAPEMPEAVLDDVYEPELVAIVEDDVVDQPIAIVAAVVAEHELEPEPVAVVEDVVAEPEPVVEEFLAPEPEVEAEPVPSFLELALAGQAVAPPPLAEDDLDTDTDVDVEAIEDDEVDEPVPSFLDLALAEQMAPPPPVDTAELDAAIQGDDVNSIVDALHRKARGERRAFPDVQLFDSAPPEPEPSPRPLRLMAPAPTSRRRWNIEFKSRHADDNL